MLDLVIGLNAAQVSWPVHSIDRHRIVLPLLDLNHLEWLYPSEQHLIQLQDPTQITFNEENKTADISGVTIEVHQFIELATKALAGGPLLD